MYFSFAANIAQSTVGDRQGSNGCTIINVWVDSCVNAVCDGNALYDELCGDTVVYLDVEDLGPECHVQSANQMVGLPMCYYRQPPASHNK